MEKDELKASEVSIGGRGRVLQSWTRGSLGGLRKQGVYASLRAPELEALERRRVPQLWEC